MVKVDNRLLSYGIRGKLFSTKEAIEITGETGQRIQYWILNGIVKPYDPSSGTGTARQFSFENLLEILIAQALSPARMYTKSLIIIMDQIRDKKFDYYFKQFCCVPAVEEQLILSFSILRKGSSYITINTIEKLKYLREGLECKLGLHIPVLSLNLDAIKNDLIKVLNKKYGRGQ